MGFWIWYANYFLYIRRKTGCLFYRDSFVNKYCNEQCIGWFMNDWWTPLCIMTRHHILGISWPNRRVSNFKILQPLSSWHRGTSCLWVQVMPFLYPGSLLWGQVKVLTLEKNLGRATRPGDEPVPGKKTKRRERNWVIVEAGPRLDYQSQITPPPPRNYSFLGEVSRTRVSSGSRAKVALSSKYDLEQQNLDLKYSRCTRKSNSKWSEPEKNWWSAIHDREAIKSKLR